MRDTMHTIAQAAAILGVDPSRVRQLIIAGRIKATRASARIILIEDADLEAYRNTPPTPGRGRPRKGTRQKGDE